MSFFRQRVEEHTRNALVWIHAPGGIPVTLAFGLTRRLEQVTKQQVGLERLGPFGDDLAAHVDRLVVLAIAPERFGQRYLCIEALRVIGNHLAEFRNRLRQHMAFGIQARQAGAAQAQLRIFATPAIGVQTQQLAANFGHIGLDFQRLFKLGNSALKLPLALGRNAKPNVGWNIFRVGAQHALKRLLRTIKLPICKIRLAKNAIRFKIIGLLIENMLGQTNRAVGVVAFERLPSLIVGRLQAHACHVDPPAGMSA